MFKKDYILIAGVIKDINSREAKGERIAELFANMLQKDNKAFTKDRFIKACK